MKVAIFTIAAASLMIGACSADDAADETIDNAVAADDAAVTEAGDVSADTAMTVCDADGNRYASDAEAEAAGLELAEFGATYCPEYLAAASGMHPSWDADGDGVNDCENDGSCDDSVDYSLPRP